MDVVARETIHKSKDQKPLPNSKFVYYDQLRRRQVHSEPYPETHRSKSLIEIFRSAHHASPGVGPRCVFWFDIISVLNIFNKFHQLCANATDTSRCHWRTTYSPASMWSLSRRRILLIILRYVWKNNGIPENCHKSVRQWNAMQNCHNQQHRDRHHRHTNHHRLQNLNGYAEPLTQQTTSDGSKRLWSCGLTYLLSPWWCAGMCQCVTKKKKTQIWKTLKHLSRNVI